VWSNGQIPASALGDIPGSNAGLLKPAALAYKAMHYHSLKTTGVSLHLIDGSIGRAYRNFARQVIARNFWCGLGKCGNAALPGTSNHGLGITVDLMTTAQRAAVDRVGAPFGWAKKWSDAAWEWWHIKFLAGIWEPKPDPTAKLPAHMKRAVRLLLYRRRERMEEGRTGEGRRWHRMNRATRRSYRKVERLHRRAKNPTFKHILALALADRDGVL
jgi:hypothetical protein